MKKTSSVIIITIVVMLLLGTVYLGSSIYRKYYIDKNKGNVGTEISTSSQQSLNDITFGDYTCKISDNDVITIKYIKSGQSIRIYSILPLANGDSYDIMSNGSMAAYLAKDGQIWIIDSSGRSKKLTPDKYNNLVKDELLKVNPQYIWAQKPQFTVDGNVVFTSNLPGSAADRSNMKKTIWKINLETGDMSIVYTPLTDDYRLLGIREDGRHLVLDGENIIVVDPKGGTENISIPDKYVLGLSPDGRRIVYMRRDRSKQPDYKSIYMMDSYGKNNMKASDIEGFIPTGTGTWNDNSSAYAYLIKSKSGDKKDIAIAVFEDNSVSVSTHGLSNDVKIPDGSKMQWADDNTISIDIGDDVLSIDINQ